MTAYAELAVSSNFSFLEGASHPEELVVSAAALGLAAVAIADRNGLAGVLRAHVAAGKAGIRPIVGACLEFGASETDERIAITLLAFPVDRAAYGRLSRLITIGRRRVPKGECHLHPGDPPSHHFGRGRSRPRRLSRAVPEAAGGDGAPFRRVSRGNRPHMRDRRPLPLPPGRAALRISERAGAGRGDGAVGARMADVGRRTRPLGDGGAGARPGPTSSLSDLTRKGLSPWLRRVHMLTCLPDGHGAQNGK